MSTKQNDGLVLWLGRRDQNGCVKCSFPWWRGGDIRNGIRTCIAALQIMLRCQSHKLNRAIVAMTMNKLLKSSRIDVKVWQVTVILMYSPLGWGRRQLNMTRCYRWANWICIMWKAFIFCSFANFKVAFDAFKRMKNTREISFESLTYVMRFFHS